jgi:hypothetical protein
MSQLPPLTPEEAAYYNNLIKLSNEGHFFQQFHQNFLEPEKTQVVEQKDEEVEESPNPKRRKPAVQRIFDQEDWTLLQQELGCIRSKKQEKNFDFEEFTSKLEKFNPLDESSYFFKNYVDRIEKSAKDLLNEKHLTMHGIRIIEEKIPSAIFMKYFWAKSSKKWGCTKK